MANMQCILYCEHLNIITYLLINIGDYDSAVV